MEENEKDEFFGKANTQNEDSIELEDLVELGFPKEITNYTFDSQRDKSRKAYRVVVSFYNALYTLSKIYEKYAFPVPQFFKTARLDLTTDGFTVYLNDTKIFSFYNSKCNFYNPRNIQKLKDIVRNLITLTGGFENLKQEFAKKYAEEYAKIHLSKGEIYNWDNLVEQEKKKFIEALKNDAEFAEKPVYLIIITGFFGDTYLPEFTDLKLKDILDKTVTSIRVYQNLLIIQARKHYAVELDEYEKYKISEFIASLKN